MASIFFIFSCGWIFSTNRVAERNHYSSAECDTFQECSADTPPCDKNLHCIDSLCEGEPRAVCVNLQKAVEKVCGSSSAKYLVQESYPSRLICQ